MLEPEFIGESGDGIAYGKEDLDLVGMGVVAVGVVLPVARAGLVVAPVGVATPDSKVPWPLTTLTTLRNSSSVSFCRLASASCTCLRIRIWMDNYKIEERSKEKSPPVVN